MNNPFGTLTPEEIGERLRKAREHANLKQAEAAEAAGMARTTLVAIEQGQRKLKIDELRKFAKTYGTSVNALMKQDAIRVDLAPKFRRLVKGDSSSIEDAVQQLTDLAQAEVELESLLGVRRDKNLPPERPIQPGDVRLQAERDALELRQWLGLGIAPISDIITLLELELGVRVFVRRLASQISGMFAFDDVLGACILLNANHPKERRTQTAAHELGHLVSTRREPEVLSLNEIHNSKEERYATAFGIAFLTPARAVIQKFNEVTLGSSTLTRRHIIILAHTFNVSREAMVRRLEDLKLARTGTWERFVEMGNITNAQAQQVLGDLISEDTRKADANRPTTLRLALLAGEAWRRELLSEGQLANMLRLSRLEVRQMFDGLEIEGSEANEALPL
ncbi:MAG: helix-turn-helix domain-containing protein [Xanthobacteraceae bacterium]|nr:helix-turn-helix domain-containing protein [Xanthobacteraceae bacterium]